MMCLLVFWFTRGLACRTNSFHGKVHCIREIKISFCFVVCCMEYLPFSHSNFKTKLEKPRKDIGGRIAPSSVGSIFQHDIYDSTSFKDGQRLIAHVRDRCASLYLLVNCPTDLLCSYKSLPAGIMLAFIPK